MIAQLSGTLADKGLDTAVIDVGGVGFTVHISLATLQALPAPGQPARLLTYLQVREDALTLYGFASAEERRAFELCISVTGVGPKMALSALSGLGPAELGAAIANEDVGRLVKVPGIGKKTAERLVMELRDKFKKSGSGSGGKAESRAAAGGKAVSGVFADVVGALCNLGYKPADAERAVAHVIDTLPEGAAAPSLEEVLRRSLRSLQRE